MVPTRAEERIVRATQIRLVRCCRAFAVVAELGSGVSGRRVILKAMGARTPTTSPDRNFTGSAYSAGASFPISTRCGVGCDVRYLDGLAESRVAAGAANRY
jgi:hypothetical protein